MNVHDKFKKKRWKSNSSTFDPVHQVCCQQPGAAGRRRLHDRLSQRSNSPQEDAWHRLAEEMLPDDRQEVRMTQRF